jgi:uncharacterized membrane protein
VDLTDIESVFGANWLARLGIAAIAVATAFFLQYAFRSGWVGPTAQVVVGLVAAMALLGTGQYLLPRSRYHTYAQVLIGGGIVIYFLSIYAAYRFYHPRVLEFGPAFAALALGALAASVLAVANRTLTIALLGILGAFAAPILIRSGQAEIAAEMLPLYFYLSAINLWVIGLLRFRPWHSLAIVAFACTWVLFFQAGPLTRGGWQTEAFAALFLLFAVYTGVRTLYSSGDTEPGESGAAAGRTSSQTAGLALILAGCIAFTLASTGILIGIGALGLPAMTIAGILVTLVLAGLAILLPDFGEQDAVIRTWTGCVGAGTLAVVLLASVATAPTIPPSEVMVAFAFTTFHFVLFLAISLLMYRRDAKDASAAAMAAAALVVHVVAAGRVLRDTMLWGTIPASAAWLSVAGVIALAALYLTLRLRRDGEAQSKVLILGSVGIPLAGLFHAVASGNAAPWFLPGVSAVFGGAFLLHSLVWISLRTGTSETPSRSEVAVPVLSAGIFFSLLARGLGFADSAGISLLAAAAILLAAYHLVIALTRLRRADLLLRLLYLGIALTFITIAVPLQLRAGYVTVAWSVEAAALMWTGLAARDQRVRRFGFILLFVAALRALLIDLPQTPAPEALLLLNPRMLSGAAVISAAYVSAWHLLRRRTGRAADEERIPMLLVILANGLTLLFVSTDLYQWVGRTTESQRGGASAQQLALSLFWLLYAFAAVSIGIWQKNRHLRLFGVGLLCLSVGKAFLFDLSWLQQPYRIVSFLVLGIILLGVSLLYTRFEGRLGTAAGAVPPDTMPGTVPGGSAG